MKSFQLFYIMAGFEALAEMQRAFVEQELENYARDIAKLLRDYYGRHHAGHGSAERYNKVLTMSTKELLDVAERLKMVIGHFDNKTTPAEIFDKMDKYPADIWIEDRERDEFQQLIDEQLAEGILTQAEHQKIESIDKALMEEDPAESEPVMGVHIDPPNYGETKRPARPTEKLQTSFSSSYYPKWERMPPAPLKNKPHILAVNYKGVLDRYGSRNFKMDLDTRYDNLNPFNNYSGI